MIIGIVENCIVFADDLTISAKTHKDLRKIMREAIRIPKTTRIYITGSKDKRRQS